MGRGDVLVRSGRPFSTHNNTASMCASPTPPQPPSPIPCPCPTLNMLENDARPGVTTPGEKMPPSSGGGAGYCAESSASGCSGATSGGGGAAPRCIAVGSACCCLLAAATSPFFLLTKAQRSKLFSHRRAAGACMYSCGGFFADRLGDHTVDVTQIRRDSGVWVYV